MSHSKYTTYSRNKLRTKTIWRADDGWGIILLDIGDYDRKMSGIIALDDYVLFSRNPTSQIERKLCKI